MKEGHFLNRMIREGNRAPVTKATLPRNLGSPFPFAATGMLTPGKPADAWAAPGAVGFLDQDIRGTHSRESLASKDSREPSLESSCEDSLEQPMARIAGLIKDFTLGIPAPSNSIFQHMQGNVAGKR